MMVKVYKKTTDKDESVYYDWQLSSEFVFSLEVSNIDTALDLLNKNNDNELAKLDVNDGDFLVDENGIPHLICDDCSRARKLGGKKFEIHRYGEY